MHFFHFATIFEKHAHGESESHAPTHNPARAHNHEHELEHAQYLLFIYFIYLIPHHEAFFLFVWNIIIHKLEIANAHITIQESHRLVFYTEEEVFFRDLCAVQLLSNPASTDAVVVIRRLCAKAHLKE